jgi:hypothetical protein
MRRALEGQYFCITFYHGFICVLHRKPVLESFRYALFETMMMAAGDNPHAVELMIDYLYLHDYSPKLGTTWKCLLSQIEDTSSASVTKCTSSFYA